MRRMLLTLLALALLACPARAEEIRYGQVWNDEDESGLTPLYDAPGGRVLGMLQGMQAVLLSGGEEQGYVNASLGDMGGYLRARDANAGDAPIAGESRLLRTYALDIAPGIEATLEVWGGALRFDFGGRGQLCEIRVIQNGAVVDRLSYLLEDAPQDAAYLRFDDMNMDGYQDVIALRRQSAGDAYAVWYLYDPAAGRFARCLDLGGFSARRYRLLPQTKMIINLLHESAASGRYETYQWQNGALTALEGGRWPREEENAAGAPLQPGQDREIVYGGSEDDLLGEIAVGADGRAVMTGYTNSHDGRLQSRTKKGRTGWALCVDGAGEVLWSFCSRLGVHDEMNCPVIHEDGSVTLLLYAERDAGQEIELIRLDARGEVAKRRTLLKADAEDYIAIAPWRMDQGYVLMRDKDADLEDIQYLLFGFDGIQAALEPDLSGVIAAAGGYAVQADAESQEGWLCRMDGFGRTERLTHLFDLGANGLLTTGIRGLLPVEDGVVGWGYTWENEAQNRRRARLMRWDADGNAVLDAFVDADVLADAVCIPSGYAATAYTAYEDGVRGGNYKWELLLLDAQGGVTHRRLLYLDSTTGVDMPLAALPDGSVMVLGLVSDDRGERDACAQWYMP